MAIFKCKMCGGDLEIANGMSVAECQYCGTQQTLPKLDDDKKANLYDRAGHFRRNNEFDKAISIYERILEEDRTDAESYWSLVLCKYGIEYVEDPTTHKRVPTVNRAQYTSIFADDNYKSAIEYADSYQKEIYEAEAKTIDDIQKGILEISNKEEPFDVFICYKETDNNGRRTPDSVLATDLYHQLTNEGFKVFFARITLEDKLGQEYEPYIFAALNSAKVMVVLGTKPEYFNAVWVKNEWSRYLSLIRNEKNKILIPAYKDMDPYDLPDEFSHLQAQDMSKLGFMQDLIRGIQKILSSTDNQPTAEQNISVPANNNIAPLLDRSFLCIEDEEFEKADELLEQVLNMNPREPRAYIGKLLCELKFNSEQKLSTLDKPLWNYKNYNKAIRFADDEYKKQIEQYNEAITGKITEQIHKIEIEIDEMSANVKAKESEQSEINGTIAGLERQIKDKSEEKENIIKELKDELRNYESQYDQMLLEKRRLSSNNRGFFQNAKISSSIEKINTALETINNTTRTLKQSLSTNPQIISCEGILNELYAKVDSEKHKNGTVNNEIYQLKSNITRLKDMKQKLEHTLLQQE